jgi:hypothetical protein
MGRKINSGLSSGVYGQLSFVNFELINKLNEIKNYQLKNKIYPHKLPMTGQLPNSTQIQKDEKGKLIRIRYYDENGNAYKDVDYIDHGTPDVHKVPHTHIIDIGYIIDRKRGE